MFPQNVYSRADTASLCFLDWAQIMQLIVIFYSNDSIRFLTVWKNKQTSM